MIGVFTSTNDASASRYVPFCCGTTLSAAGRRAFLRTVGGSVLFTSVSLVASGTAVAASGNYEAMVLSCIDPRFQDLVNRRQARDGLSGKYSAFSIAGAAIGVVAPAFKDWHKTFWDNLSASVQLHNIKKVIVVNHRDCGAAKIAYGDAKVSSPAVETVTHREALLEFRKQLTEKHPKLGVQLGLMSLDGNLEQFV